MKKLLITLLFAQTALLSCQTDEGNEKLAEAGETVGKSAATIAKSVKSGIEKATKININISENLKTRGLSTGKVTLGSKGGRHNVLNVYMIFEKRINRNLTMKVLDADGLELGRTKVLVKGEAGDAKFVDFVFDTRTNIDRDNKIVME
ncbi:MAG TPA: hypothetical protein VK175_02120 [Leadbetterella sp.]|nr:hypothetical protein [Leadbetterella sp.]